MAETTVTLGAGWTQLATEAVYNRQLLARALPELLHQQFGQTKTLPNRSGKSMLFRRYESLDQVTTPLSEGVTPDGTALSKTDLAATINQYGNFVTVTDMVDLTHVDPVISETVSLMGENMGETIDSIHRDILCGGTNFGGMTGDGEVTASTGPDEAIAGHIHPVGLDWAIRLLDSANAKHFTPMVAGTNKIGTAPIAKSYWAIIHPDMVHDFYNDADFNVGTDFIPVERYAAHTGAMSNEIGKYRNIRFITSTNAKVSAGSSSEATVGYKQTDNLNDVYSVLIFARDAYGIIPLQGGATKTIIHRAGGPTDPLNQRNTIGWKAATTAKILNDAWMCRLECAVKA